MPEYRSKGLTTIRPYVVGEDLSNITVPNGVTPARGGMIVEEDNYITARDFAHDYDEFHRSDQ